jgi:serine/threonine-protein kinase
MSADPDATRTQNPAPTDTFDPALEAGLVAAFGPELTPGGWSRPPLLRDDTPDNAPIVRPSAPGVPRNCERYELLGEIARGGMGVILKGRDPELGRDLAVKVLRTDLAHRPAAEQRFVEEAQVCGQLQHPGVVPVYDLGRFADGSPYFTMKLLKGRTLADWFAERKDPGAERGRALQIFSQVCQTMAYVHARGVIHRDLKPSNVMVGDFGEVLLMDWGLAKLLPRGGVADEARERRAGRPDASAPTEEPTEIRTSRSGSASETVAGSVLGTPAFMPPEQAGGEIEKLDERADVFGLGAILCVLLTGQPPYVTEGPEAVRLMAVRGQLAECFGRLEGCGADVTLIELCKQCLAPDRDARPRNAGAVAGAVTTYLAEVERRAQQAELHRAALAVEAREQRKRLRIQLLLGVALGLLLLGGGGFAWWQDRQRSRAGAEREVRRQAAVASLDKVSDALLADKRTEVDAAMAQAGEQVAAVGSEDLQVRLDELQRARDLALALEDIAVQRLTGELTSTDAGETAYPRAFRRFGLAVGEMDAAAAAEVIRRSPIRERLIDGLDAWLAMARGPRAVALRELLALVDPDPYLTTVRKQVGVYFLDLPPEIDPRRLRPGLAAALTDTMGWDHERDGRDSSALRLLRAAWSARPDRFDINYRLAQRLADSPPPARNEALGFYRAALAIRPTCAAVWGELAEALRTCGNVEAALECHRRALALDPNRQQSHKGYAYTLYTQKRYTEALAQLEREMVRHPDWVPELRCGAACYALRAATGAGADPAPREQWPALRARALQWLTAECEALAASKEGIDVAAFARHWLTDSDLAPVRDRIDELPRDEQPAWRRLWADLRTLSTRPDPFPRW